MTLKFLQNSLYLSRDQNAMLRTDFGARLTSNNITHDELSSHTEASAERTCHIVLETSL